MIRRIHHVQITIPPGSEDRARRFYCDVLGLPEIDKPDSLSDRGGFWLQVGGQPVHVGVEETADRRATKAHIAYEVGNLADLRRRLVETGIEILEGIPIPDYERFEFRFRDPFGNRVELIQPMSDEVATCR